MSLKVCDYNTVPLCHAHHMELHDHGNEEQWWALQGVDPINFIEKVTND
jgi:predicted nucleic acid binding AN1-type Zn finger protein